MRMSVKYLVSKAKKRYNESMHKVSGLTWVSGTDTPIETYVTRVLNFGTWEEFNALNRSVSRQQILDAMAHPLRGQWTSRGKAFAECVFGCTLPDDVLISYECP